VGRRRHPAERRPARPGRTTAITQTRLLRSSKVASALQAIADSLDSLAAHTSVVITDGAGQVTSIAVTAQAAIAGSQLPRQFAGHLLSTVNSDVIDTIVAPHRAADHRPHPAARPRRAGCRPPCPRPGGRGGGQPGEGGPRHGAAGPRRRCRPAAVPGDGDLPHRAERRRPRRHPGLGHRERATLQGWEWLSSRAATTCPACWAQDGTIHELTETGPDGHVNCRCTRMVRTKTWRELGIDLDEPAGLPASPPRTTSGR
jgi:hypothetical protein